MTTSEIDEFLGRFGSATLQHVYDPVKAREYYLRTRKLKGRKKGTADLKTTDGIRRSGEPSKQQKAAAERKAKREALKLDTEERVARFKKRLERLEAVLDELVKQAKERSGVETKEKSSSSSSSSSSKSSSSSSKDSKPKTAAQKREDAKKAKERREKENPGGDSEEKALKEKIQAVREKIKDMKAQIAAAKKKAKSSKKTDAKSKTARNGR